MKISLIYAMYLDHIQSHSSAAASLVAFPQHISLSILLGFLLLLICKPCVQSINGIHMSTCGCLLGLDNLPMTTSPEKGESLSQVLTCSKLWIYILFFLERVSSIANRQRIFIGPYLSIEFLASFSESVHIMFQRFP